MKERAFIYFIKNHETSNLNSQFLISVPSLLLAEA